MRKSDLARLVALSALALGPIGLTGCDREAAISTSAGTTTTDTTAASATPAPATPVKPAPPAVSFNEQFQDVTGPVQPDRITAKVIQTVSLFNRPYSSTISLDGRHLFVTNSAATLNGMLYRQGGISKLEIGADGRLSMVKQKFVEDLQQPMGIAVLPKGTTKFPAGSLFVSVGTTDACDDKNNRIVDIEKFTPGVAVIDPDTGKQIGFIAMGPGKAVAKAVYHPIIAPSGICFDPNGDLFLADGGNTGKALDPQIPGRPGIVRIPNAGIDTAAEDKDPGSVAFLPVRHVPAAVFYSRLDDAMYWTTCDGAPGAGGAVYRTPRKTFPLQNEVSNVVGDLGPLMGLAITPTGTLVVSRLDGDLYFVNSKRFDAIPFTENGLFASPGDIKMLTLKNGQNLLYIPEQEPTATEPWKQRLRVVLLPSIH